MKALFGSWMLYTALYLLFSCAILVALVLSLFVSFQFRKGQLHVTPVKILRVLVPLLVQGAYILALHLLLHPLMCTSESKVQGAYILACAFITHDAHSLFDSKCTDKASWLVYLSVSTVLLLLFIPFCLAMSEVIVLVIPNPNVIVSPKTSTAGFVTRHTQPNHHHDPRNHELEARPHGHAQVLYLAVRTIVVFVAAFSQQNHSLSHPCSLFFMDFKAYTASWSNRSIDQR